MKYKIITYGCQMNVSDSERLSSVLDQAGYTSVNDEGEADLLLVNACSVRQKAIDRIWGKLRVIEAREQKESRQITKVLTGCVLPDDRPKFASRFDLFFPIKDLPKLPELLSQLLSANGETGQTEKQKNKKTEKQLINGTIGQLNQNGVTLEGAPATDRIPDSIASLQNDNHTPNEPLNPISQSPGSEKHYLQIQPNYSNKFSAFVPIMTGCNAHCTYCAVPYTRGREVSRKPEEIIQEVQNLIASGYKEITLLGQIINKYLVKVDDTFFKYLDWILSKHGVEFNNIPELQESVLREKKLFKFHHLLAVLALLSPLARGRAGEGSEPLPAPLLIKERENNPPRSLLGKGGSKFWLRFTSSHPKWFTNELIDTIKRYDALVEHIHLPVQSGSDSVLKRMLRPYKIEDYKKIISYIREQMPEASITTDTIVGFCGETEEEFNETIELYNWAKYDLAYIAQYSTRPDTTAQKQLTDDVPHKVKVARDKELTAVLEKSALEHNKKYLEQEVEILITGTNNEHVFGRTRTNKNIKLTTNDKQLMTNGVIGQFVTARVTDTKAWHLQGELVYEE